MSPCQSRSQFASLSEIFPLGIENLSGNWNSSILITYPAFSHSIYYCVAIVQLILYADFGLHILSSWSWLDHWGFPVWSSFLLQQSASTTLSSLPDEARSRCAVHICLTTLLSISLTSMLYVSPIACQNCKEVTGSEYPQLYFRVFHGLLKTSKRKLEIEG